MNVHLPPGTSAVEIALTVNGAPRAALVHPFDTLADVLRDTLGLTGTKIGCNAGDCGACTVLLDGAQVCACLVPAAQAGGRQIHTVEGAGPGGVTERLRATFHQHGAAQCGICTPGMLMAAADLLAREPQPARAQVEDAIGGVLCRCTGYVKIVEAVLAASGAVIPGERSETRDLSANEAPNAARDPGSPLRSGRDDAIAHVGARIPRLDGWPKVAGTDLFGADTAPPDTLWLRVVRSPHARATFALGDLEAFRASRPGIEAVVTASDVPGENSFGIFPNTKDQPVFAEREVRYRGDPVLGLVGTKEALDTVDDADVPIVWTPLPAIVGPDAALAPGAAVLHESCPDNVLTRGRLSCGDPDRARAAAAATAEGAFETSFVEHAYIEPEAGYAVPTGPDTIEVFACTQAPYMDRDETARVLGLPPENVRIRPSACGGGFGGKLDVSVQPLLAVAAWKVRRPVRMVYSRIESMASSTKRHPARIAARAAADGEGRLLSYESEADFDTGAYASWGPTVANRVPVHASGPYRVPHVRNRARAIYTNGPPSGAFRGFGVPQAAIAHECLMDDLAQALGLDRWDIRRRNALAVGDRTPSGQLLISSAGLPACLDALRPEWDAMLARVAAHNAANARRRRGAGIGCMWYGCGNTALPNPSTMRVTLSREGRLTFHNGAVDIGQGSTTVLAQILADALGLPVERFEMVVGDTALTADAGKTSASRQTFVSGNAARLAGEDLRRNILGLANVGERASIALDGATLVIREGAARRTVDLSQLAADGDGIVLEGLGTYDPPTTPLDENGQGVPYATYGFAAQIAEVEVDVALGTTKVLTIVAAHDVGRAVNPTLVEGQIHGGIAQGLGLALMEEYIPGRTENLHDYLIPTVGDMPEIVVKLIEDPEAEGPYGAKGVGEPALIATAPAILGAIRHATGTTIRHVPALPHRVWEALHPPSPGGGGSDRDSDPGWGDSASERGANVAAAALSGTAVTPTRACGATSPLQGEVGRQHGQGIQPLAQAEARQRPPSPGGGGSDRASDPGWGDSASGDRANVVACSSSETSVTPSRACGATSPLQGEVGRQQRDAIYPLAQAQGPQHPPSPGGGGSDRASDPGWGDSASGDGVNVAACASSGSAVTPTRAFGATSPLQGEVGREPVDGLTRFRRARAKALRDRTTDAERKLWRALKSVPVAGSHFRRQVPVGPYVADFACLAARLIIELDGGHHSQDEVAARDATRQAWLKREGYRVLRFWNAEVVDNLNGVLDTIYAALHGSLADEPRRLLRQRRTRPAHGGAR